MKNLFLIAAFLILITSYSQEVKINENFHVNSNGWVWLDAPAQAFEDLRVTLDRGNDATAIGYVWGTNGPQVWYFRANNTVEAMSFIVQLPHSWREGTTIYPHIHWFPKNSSDGTKKIQWNFEWSWANPNEPFPTYTTYNIVADVPATAYTHVITPLTPNNTGLDGTGKSISSILICRIWRNSALTNDTYDADAGTLFIDFHYEVDSFGSREEYTK